MQIRKENDYLVISSREKCKHILSKEIRTKDDIIDFLINLHLVLEIGLNTFYRHIILMGIVKDISHTKIVENLDKIGFAEKTTLFFYLPNFDFQGYEAEAGKYHSAIRMIGDFSGIRNNLLHGHMIWEIILGENRRPSRTFELITEDSIKSQIEKFKFILEAVSFYFDHLDSPITQEWREDYKKAYLNDDFLN